ncbi:CCT-alpha [Aphelenchoides bicaudatus]|nr:CCT-alpha [Aphelenchoides bicaudatus]
MGKTKKATKTQAKADKPEMNQDEQTKLIRLIQSRPVIYVEQTKLKDRNSAWAEIFGLFGEKFTVDLLKKRWNGLRSFYKKFVDGEQKLKNFWARNLMTFLGTAENFGSHVKTKAAAPLKLPVKQSSDDENEGSEQEDVCEVNKDHLIHAAKSSMSSRLIGADADYLAELCVEATQLVKVTDSNNKVTYPISAINILKSHGKSARETQLIRGYALNCTRASDAMPRKVVGAKITCLDFSLQRQKMHLGISVVVDDPTKLEAIRREEMDITKRRIEKILKAGANVILTTGGIDDLCLKQFTEAGVMAVSTSLATLGGDEKFDVSLLGTAEEVAQERVSDDELILIETTKARTSASVILREASDAMLDEMERSLHDALYAVKRVLENKKLVNKKKLSKWWIDQSLQPGGTYTIVDKKLHAKLLKNNKNDLMSLTKCVFGFGMVFLTSYEERWTLYKERVNVQAKTAFLGSGRFAMIKLRQWTPKEQLPTYAINNGHAAYIDEYSLHSLPFDFNKDFATTPGTDTTAISFLNLNSEKFGRDKSLQNEMTEVLMNALLNPEFVEEEVPCPACDETYISRTGLHWHIELYCQFTKDPYTEYRAINWEEIAKPVRENRLKRRLLLSKEDEAAPPSKRFDIDL